jgi:hypothetical protein
MLQWPEMNQETGNGFPFSWPGAPAVRVSLPAELVLFLLERLWGGA